MKIPMAAVAGLAATGMVVGVSVVGCTANKSSTTSSSGSATSPASSSATSSSSSAPAADYTALLIKASDITLPGDTFTAQPPIQNPNGQPGVAQIFSNQNDTRHIGNTILILPDADRAVSELDLEKAALGDMVTGGTPTPAAVGTAGTMVSGTSPDGSKAVTVLLFTEGKAFTNLEFDSPPNDPVPPGFVTDVGQKQDAAIKNGLHG
ncbi:hypothetical protein [Mycobacterium sp.]|jgi:hypothetical protein|uniref:hypothetical protein n=1 Tax=Mycobacterium sp. TaxID=1785 RepID=UPI00333F8A48